MQTNSYSFLMTVGENVTHVGFNGFTDLGALKRIAKQSNKPKDADLFGRVDIDLNADFRVATGDAKKLPVADELVITLEGYDVNVAGTTPTSGYGLPIRLVWDGLTETYSAVGTASAQRASLLTFMQENVGNDIRLSITNYTVPTS